MNRNLFIREANLHGNNLGVWYFLGCLISFGLGQILGAIPMIVIIILNGNLDTLNPTDILNPSQHGLDKNVFLILVLLPFVIGTILLWLYVRIAHRKPFKLLITPFKKIRWSYFFGAAGVWGIFLLISELINYSQYPDSYTVEFDSEKFLPLLFLSLTLLLIQTSFEELLFRGYIMQWMGRYFKSAWIPLIITSIGFGLVHGANPEIAEYGPSIMIIYIAMGLALGYVTLMSRSLEMALGMHFVNNFFASAIVNYNDSALNTDSILKVSGVEFGTTQYVTSILTLILFLILMKIIFKLDFNIDRDEQRNSEVLP